MSLLALVGVSHLFDLATFLVCARVFPISDELNPVMRMVYGAGGEPAVVIFKVAAIALALGILYLTKAPAWAFYIAAAVGLIGGLVNTASLLTLR